MGRMAGDEVLLDGEMTSGGQVFLFDGETNVKQLVPARKTSGKKRLTRNQLIAQLGPGVWKLPPQDWLLAFRRHDGSVEIRNVHGSLDDARRSRDDALKSGRYLYSWLRELR